MPITLKISHVRRVLDQLKSVQSATICVGTQPGKTYPNGTKLSMVATQQEFGNAHLPARSFLRSTMSERQDEWRRALLSNIRQNGWSDLNHSLDQLGQLAAANVQEKIRSILTPPLTPITIQERQAKIKQGTSLSPATKPLIDTGTLLNAIIYWKKDTPPK